MAWENSDRASRLPEEWPKIVRQVKKRDQTRCRKILPSGVRCPRTGTDVDHKVPGDDHRMINLQLLCPTHHQQKTVADNRRSLAARRASKTRKPEKHPGEW